MFNRVKSPAGWRGPHRLRSVAVAVRAGPDQLQTFLAFDLDQGRVDRGGKARVVQLDRDVVALAALGLFLPSGAEFDRAGEDAELRAIFGGVLDALEAGLDVEGERLDLTGEAVLGQPLAVI